LRHPFAGAGSIGTVDTRANGSSLPFRFQRPSLLIFIGNHSQFNTSLLRHPCYIVEQSSADRVAQRRVDIPKPCKPQTTNGSGPSSSGGMHRMKIKIAGCLVILMALVVLGVYPIDAARSGNQINWYTYDEGMTQARQSGKSIVFYFYADWCTYCVRMQKETFSHDSVIDFMNNRVIAVKVDVDKEKKVSRAFGVRGLPATVLLMRNGEQVGPMPGFIPPKSYLAMLNKIMEQS
jgi:thioredoxin-related protein